MSRMDELRVARVLSESPHFAGFAEDHRADLARMARVAEWPACRSLRSTSLHEAFWIVLAGAVQVGFREAGRDLTYAVLGAGSFYGANPVVGEHGPATLLRTIAPTALGVIAQPAMRQLMLSRRELRYGLEALAMRRVVNAEYIFADAAFLPARANIAGRILMQALSSRRDGRVDGCEISVTHAVLAQMIGISRASLALELETLEAEGAIRRLYRRLVVSDQKALERAATRPVEAI